MMRLVCLFRGHVLACTGRRLSLLAEVRCLRCGAHLCYNAEERRTLPWSDGMEVFFERELLRARTGWFGRTRDATTH